jgi:hypothetical protein
MIDRRTLLLPLLAAAPAIGFWPAKTRAAPAGRVVTGQLSMLQDRPWTPVIIDGKGPFRFLIDTGDEAQCSIVEAVAKRAGLPVVGEVRSAGIVGENLNANYLGHRVQIGGAFEQNEVAFEACPPLGGLDGILPAHLFQGQDSDLDFEAGEYRLYWNKDPDRTGFFPIDYDSARSNHGVIVNCRLDDRPVRLQVDTGATGCVTLLSRYVLQRNLWNAPARYLQGTAIGLTGGTASRTYRGDTLLFGPVRFHNPIVEMLDPEHGSPNGGGADGLIGIDVLRRFTLSFQNFPRPRLWVKANSRLGDFFRVDRSGLSVGYSRKEGAVVLAVAPGTAAETAGLKRGDRLPALRSHEAVRDFDWSLTDAEGTAIPLQVERDGQPLAPIKLVLTDRI